jgi:hypothetical protein
MPYLAQECLVAHPQPSRCLQAVPMDVIEDLMKRGPLCFLGRAAHDLAQTHTLLPEYGN